MAQDIKKSKKRKYVKTTEGPLFELVGGIKDIYRVFKDHSDSKKRKKHKAVLEKNKDMIMGGIEGYRRPSGRKANPTRFTLAEMQGFENPSYPLTKKQKLRIYGDPEAKGQSSRKRSSGLLKNKKSVFEKEYYESGGLTKTVPPKRGPNPQGLKGGGCPYREMGAKSDIQGIKDIQVKGKKFTGVK